MFFYSNFACYLNFMCVFSFFNYDVCVYRMKFNSKAVNNDVNHTVIDTSANSMFLKRNCLLQFLTFSCHVCFDYQM